MKLFNHSKSLVRNRIPLPDQEVIEMHRNTRVDYYDHQIAELFSNSIDFTKLNRYPDVQSFQKKLADFYHLDEKEVLVTSGIDGGIKSILEMCTSSGSKVGFLTPTYGMYHVYCKAFDVEQVPIESDINTLTTDFNLVLDAIDKDLDVLFIQNPHEPIENIFTIEDLKDIIYAASKHDTLICIDEAYFMFGAPSFINEAVKYTNVLVARTFSKGFGLPAIRLGFLVGDRTLIRHLSSKRFAHETNSLSINIASFALDNYDIFHNYINNITNTRDWFINELRILGYKSHGEKSNTVIIDLFDKETATKKYEHLKEKNIWVRQLPNPFSKFLSVTIGNQTIMTKLLREL